MLWRPRRLLSALPRNPPVIAVGHRLKSMDTRISALTDKTKCIHTNIASLQDRVEGVVGRLTAMEVHLNKVSDRNRELLCLQDKITDLEDWSRRDDVYFFDFLEHAEGADVKGFSKDLIPLLTGLIFTPPLELQ
ncbi:hypothetical protein NDU88_001746 [Pleurodeles waltl]|uniref:Uncharacterized protein n=1 Tax=Pleurodeles waltl TaxID=8319 RepID=A0AAV7WQB2_PLEWA|nr:hypothetical protein NDU88_001746 [Pleurodeles waltl]